VIDYGCGVGRLSKALIERHGCRVVGVDISAKMRALAVDYVGSDRFFACPPDMLTALADNGFRADAAFSVWVLQHCFNPRDDISRLHRSLRGGGRFFIVNNTNRRVPTRERAWVDDGIDVRAMLGEYFTLREQGVPADHVTPSNLRNVVFWGCYQRPG